ncbi:hypothetical protein [Agrobacterium sp. B1(2019)]|uniref:hypothetical protein n=1 Tax=Agrobacterium sp. B1(2019) TaxID=2607032 RepID=UPI0011EDEFA6|nr:hypothetical protein [Agrobacterium sp. B1(2019)]TZG36732.1 hypothetical protein AGR1_04350 [Agrobacterium sp. B1(2019)]
MVGAEQVAPYAELIKISLVPTVTFMIWVLTQVVTLFDKKKRSRDEKKKLIRSLYAEIDFNTADLAGFLAVPFPYDVFVARISEDNSFIPHITDARHTHIYIKNIDLISVPGEEYVGDIVHFYGGLAKIRAKIDGIYMSSFPKISLEGRKSIIRSLYEEAESAKMIGEKLLKAMEERHKKYNLTRK